MENHHFRGPKKKADSPYCDAGSVCIDFDAEVACLWFGMREASFELGWVGGVLCVHRLPFFTPQVGCGFLGIIALDRFSNQSCMFRVHVQQTENGDL